MSVLVMVILFSLAGSQCAGHQPQAGEAGSASHSCSRCWIISQCPWVLLAASRHLHKGLLAAEGPGAGWRWWGHSRALRCDYWRRRCNSPRSHVMRATWWATSCRSTNSSFLNQNLIFQQEVVCGAEQDSRASIVIKACQQTNLLLILVNKTLCRWNALERTGMYR